MKNTRIARLKQSKRVRKVSKVVAIGLLVCPLTLGAINALADTETTEPVTEEVAPVEETETVASETVESTEPVETVELTPVDEEVQQPVFEVVQPEITAPEVPAVTPSLLVDEDGTTRGTLEELGADLSELRSLYAQVTAEIDKGDPVAGTSTIYTDESYLAFLTDVVDKWANTEQFFTTDHHTAEDVPVQMAYVNDFIAAFQSGLSKLVLRDTNEQDPAKDAQIEALREQIDVLIAGIEPLATGTDYQQRYEDLELARIVVVTSKANFVDWYGWNYWYNYAIPELERIVNELTALKAEISISQDADLTKLQKNYDKYNSLNEADYTPESWAEFLKFVNEDMLYLALSTEALLADPEGFLDYSAFTLNQWWEQAFALLVAKDDDNGGDNTDNGNNGGNGTDNTNNSDNQKGNTGNSSNTNQDENNNNSSNPIDPSNTNSNNNKANNKTATNNNTKDTTNLPQTGDTPTNMLISGLTMLGASLIAILVRRRKKA